MKKIVLRLVLNAETGNYHITFWPKLPFPVIVFFTFQLEPVCVCRKSSVVTAGSAYLAVDAATARHNVKTLRTSSTVVSTSELYSCHSTLVINVFNIFHICSMVFLIELLNLH